MQNFQVPTYALTGMKLYYYFKNGLKIQILANKTVYIKFEHSV